MGWGQKRDRQHPLCEQEYRWQVWEFGSKCKGLWPTAPAKGSTAGSRWWVHFDAQTGLCALTYLFFHPGHILSEVAHFPGQKTLSGLQEIEKLWVGKSLASPHVWHHQDKLGSYGRHNEKRTGGQACVKAHQLT